MSQATAHPDGTHEAEPADESPIHILWINAGLSCDGDSVALTAATQPSIEEIALGALPGLPKVAVHWPLIDFENGPVGGADDFLEWFFKASRGELEPFVLVVEGSIPNEAIRTPAIDARGSPADVPSIGTCHSRSPRSAATKARSPLIASPAGDASEVGQVTFGRT